MQHQEISGEQNVGRRRFNEFKSADKAADNSDPEPLSIELLFNGSCLRLRKCYVSCLLYKNFFDISELLDTPIKAFELTTLLAQLQPFYE